MLPPQAPPAYVAHANQAAVDMLQRLADTQRWLVEQQTALPEPPHESGGRDAFLGELDAFWQAPVEHAPGRPAVPRRQAFALRLAQATRDDASLRRNDGTLTDEAAALVTRIALHPGGPLPGHLHASELLFGAVPYAGALVLQDDRQPGQVLLFTVEAGWLAFDTLDALYRDVELDLRQQLAHRRELPGIGQDDVEGAIDTPFLGARPLEGDLFDALAGRLIARQRERAAAAFDGAATGAGLADALHPALNLHTLLDLHAIVRHRDLALAARHDQERLARQPATVRDAWRQAALDYRDRWRLAETTSPAAIPTLATFADDALATALGKRGIHVPPRELRVRLIRQTAENPLATALTTGIALGTGEGTGGFAYEEMSLLELAYRNIGSLPNEGLSVVHADGSSRTDVSAPALREVVRDLDLPRRYAQHLDDTLRDSAEGRERRAVATGLQRAQMRFEAADARLSYIDTTEPASFLDDHQERGFLWVQAVLDHPEPKGRARVGGHEVVVHQLTYQGAPLAGVFLLGARQSQAVSRVILYTPDAPDGIAFREFGSRAELTRRFLLDPTDETYLLDRLPAQFTERDAHGQRHFKLARGNDGRTASWVLNLPDCGHCTRLAERFQEREVTGSFLDAGYDTAIHLAKRNANDLTRSTAAASVEAAWEAFWGWNLPVQLVKELVTGVAQSVPRTAQAAWRFYDQVKAGEGTGAFLAFVEGYTSALNVLPLYTQVPALAGARVRAAPGARTLVPSRRALPAPDTLFEERFLARGVSVPSGKPSASGVYTVAGQNYIQQRGRMYHVAFDADIAGWRLSRPGALDARFTGPAIEPLPNGQWHFRHVGLRGGVAPNSLLELSVLEATLTHGAPMNTTLRQLTPHQRSVVARELLDRLPSFEQALHVAQSTADFAGPRGPLSLTQRRAWNRSLEAGRRAPPDAPPIDLSEELGLLAETIRDPAAISASLQPLTQYQRSVVIGNLHSRLPFDEALRIARGMNTEPAILTPTHLRIWNEALEVGRRAPTHNPNPPSLPGNTTTAGPELTGSSGTRHSPAPAPGNPGTSQTASDARINRARQPLLPQGGDSLVPRENWPGAVYLYLPSTRLQRALGPGSLAIPQYRVNGTTHGVAVSTMAPETLSVPSGGAVGWVRIDMSRLSARTHRPLELLRGLDADGGGFILRPARNASLPLADELPVIFSRDEFTYGFFQP
jgi:hypothetical protein